MRPFAFARPTEVDEAVRAVAGDPEAVFLAGGTNLVDHLRLGVARPALVVDVRTLTSREVTDAGDGGLRIGAAVTNSQLAADRRVRERYPVRAQALHQTLPLVSGKLPDMLDHAADQACARVQCSPDERKALGNVLNGPAQAPPEASPPDESAPALPPPQAPAPVGTPT